MPVGRRVGAAAFGALSSVSHMLEPDSDDTLDNNNIFDIGYAPIYNQWHTERWLMEILLWPAKAPRSHPVDKLTWIACGKANLAVVLAALERDGLIRRSGESVSATKAAISFWRLELAQASPLR
jgi:hypothetical protein